MEKDAFFLFDIRFLELILEGGFIKEMRQDMSINVMPVPLRHIIWYCYCGYIMTLLMRGKCFSSFSGDLSR